MITDVLPPQPQSTNTEATPSQQQSTVSTNGWVDEDRDVFGSKTTLKIHPVKTFYIFR